MVAHWRKVQGRHFLSMFLNGLGAVTTAITVVVVLVAKFVEGAWITLALIPVLFVVMKAVHRQYALVENEIELHEPRGPNFRRRITADAFVCTELSVFIEVAGN